MEEDELTDEEMGVWNLRDDILDLINDLPRIDDVRVSETMRVIGGSDWTTRGTWSSSEKRIVVHRPVLSDPVEFAATLLHEVAHPYSGEAPDQTREFERALTDLLGEVSTQALE